MQASKVLIIVLNWMKYEDTINCVESLLKLDYLNFNILVIDNNSLNESAEIITKRFPEILFIKSNRNDGYAAGNKIGVDYALKNNFDAVWILNNDCVARKESLSELVASFNRNGNAIYSNLTLMSENPDIIHYAGTYAIEEPLQPDKYPTYDKLKGKLLADYLNVLEEKPARIYGHSLYIPIEVIKKHGFMDTRYFMFCEETDYTLSLHKAGIHSIFVPKAIITHISTSTFKLSAKMKFIGMYYGIRNNILLDKKFNNGYCKELLNKKGGLIGIIKFFVLSYLLKIKPFNEEDYYTNLGILHGVLGIRGKVIKPEKLL